MNRSLIKEKTLNNHNSNSSTSSGASNYSSSSSSNSKSNISTLNKNRKKTKYGGLSIEQFFEKKTQEYHTILDTAKSAPKRMSNREINEKFDKSFQIFTKNNKVLNTTNNNDKIDNTNNISSTTSSSNFSLIRNNKKPLNKEEIQKRKADVILKRMNFDMRLSNAKDNNFLDDSSTKSKSMLPGTSRKIKLELPSNYQPLGGKNCLTRFCYNRHNGLKLFHRSIQSILTPKIGKKCNHQIMQLEMMKTLERFKDNDQEISINFKNKFFNATALSFQVVNIPIFKFYIVVAKNPRSEKPMKKNKVDWFLLDFFYYQINDTLNK